MTVIRIARKFFNQLLTLSVSARELFASLLLAAILMPIAAPVPAWAYNLNASKVNEDGKLPLEAPGVSLLTSITDFAESSFENVIAMILPAAKAGKRVALSHAKEALENKVTKFQIDLKDDQTVNVGQVIPLTALPLDKKDNIINGLVPQWKTSNPDIIKISGGAEAIALDVGEATLTVFSGKIKEDLVVKVVAGDPALARRVNAIAPPPNLMLEAATDPAIVESLYTPANNLGNPLGQVEMSGHTAAAATQIKERIGAANFSFGVPLASLPGRGLSASIGLAYNSRVWNKIGQATSGNVYNFNVDRNWLAPGFNVGFGYIDRFIVAGTKPSNYVFSYSLVDADGTRHQISFKETDSYTNYYESTDGTFIKASFAPYVEYGSSTMEVKYPDGSKVLFGSLMPETWQGNPDQGRRFPIRITDKQGNFISISYVSDDIFGKIDTITDTLGRYINFHYEGPDLISVTVPGYNNSSTPRETVRLFYDDITLDTSTTRFNNGTVSPELPSSIRVLKYLYFPGTQSGFKYDYSTAWGTINKISNLRGMTVSSSAVTGEGEVAATTTYNYSSSLGTPLEDVPTFTTRTDDWLGRTTSAAPVTTFAITKDTVNNRTVSKITSPDGTISETWARISEGGWDNGLVTDTFTRTLIDPVGQTYKTWAHEKLFWDDQSITTGRRNPRVEKVEDTNDADQTKAVTFEYDDYNNATVVKEYDFASPGSLGTELRKTQTTYETENHFLYNDLVHLPTSVKTIVGGTTVSRTDYEYDGDNLGSYDEETLVQYDPSYNSNTAVSEVCYDACPTECIDFGSPICGCPLERVCDRSSAYNGTTQYRGNLTKIKSFADPTNDSDPNAVVNTMMYDLTGNVIQASLNCCNLKTTEYSVDNNYAYPTKETRGSSPQLVTKTAYDFNTGLSVSTTDENDQDTTVTYDPDSLRQTRVDGANGAWATSEFNLTAYPYYVKTTASLDSTRSVASWNFSNGLGQQFRSRSLTANGYISSDVEFDNLGRPVKAFNPYTVSAITTARPSGIKYSQITQTDGLGRVLESTLPDNTTVSAEYSGMVGTVTDQAGKKRRQIADALGRLVRVDEPDSSGSLGATTSPVQPTSYEYDGNDNLKKITQTTGGTTQERLFKYDPLSRLRWEKQVEATADLNDAGQKVTSGGLWTGVYNYNTHNLLTDGTDARGVKTTYTYDGLNRISTVAYTGESGYQTPTVTYTYDQAHSGYYNKGRVTKIETAAVTGTQATPATVQNYDYSKVGQVVNHSQGIGSQSYGLQYAYNLGGQLTTETYPSGKVVTNTVDNYGVTQTVADAQRTYLSSVALNTQGMPSQVNLGNGTSETYSFNDRLQMTSQSLLKSSAVLQKYDYSFGQITLSDGSVDTTKNNGQLAKVEGYIGSTKQWSQRFAYDELGRLSESREYKSGDNSHLTYKQKFDFDRFGNLYRKAANNSTSGQENPLAYTAIEDSDISKSTNRYTSGTTYNEAGQVTADSKFRNMGFAYDGNGRLIKATKTSIPDALTVYDALGNRVATKVNSVWQYMIYDAFGQLVAEYGAQTEGAGGTKFIQQDSQSSVRTVTNSNGYVIARTDHQAFGEEIGVGVGVRSVDQGYNADPATLQGYGSTEHDTGTGQQHTGFRKLETFAGRWSSPDPSKSSMSVGNPQSFNRYSYVADDPLNFIDPSGLEMCDASYSWAQCGGAGGFWSGGSGGFGSHVASYNEAFGWLPPGVQRELNEQIREFERWLSSNGAVYIGNFTWGVGDSSLTFNPGHGWDGFFDNATGRFYVPELSSRMTVLGLNGVVNFDTPPRGESEKEHSARIERNYESCLRGEMRELRGELEFMMNVGLGGVATIAYQTGKASKSAQQVSGALVPALALWLYTIVDFQDRKWTPALKVAKVKCKASSGYSGPN